MRAANRLFSVMTMACLVACGGGSGTEPGATATALDSKAQIQAATLGTDATDATADSEVALAPISATASSQERGDLSAAKTIDHDVSTRWSSTFSDAQWLSLDYGQVVAIDRLQIAWENAHAKRYQIQVSTDGNNWTTLRTISDSVGGTENHTALGGQGRYLRVNGLERSTQYGYSIF